MPIRDNNIDLDLVSSEDLPPLKAGEQAGDLGPRERHR